MVKQTLIVIIEVFIKNNTNNNQMTKHLMKCFIYLLKYM